MGDGSHGRSAKEGFVLSIEPTGEGEEELARQVRQSKRGFLSRSEEDRPSLLTFRFYKKIKRGDNDAQLAADASTIQTSVIDDVVHIVRGASWFGLAAFM